MMTPPEHRAQTRRWGRDENKKKKKRDRRRRERCRRRRRAGDVAAQDASVAGFDFDDVAKALSSPVNKKPRRWLPSQIGEVFGSLCRVESVTVPTPSSTPAIHGYPEEGVVLLPPEAALSLPTPAAASTTTTSGLFSPPAPPPPSSSSSQVLAPVDKNKGLLFTASMPIPLPPPPPVPAAPIMRPKKRKMSPAMHQTPGSSSFTASMPPPPPPPVPAASMRSKKMKMSPATHQPPATSRRAAAPPLPLLPPPPQPADDAFERQEFLKQRFAELIAKSQQAIDERYREDLKRGRVAPEPEPTTKPVVVDKEALRRSAAIATDRRRFVLWLRKTEIKAKRDALFMQNARREHVRALGIDAAMERVVSSHRPRDGDGEPIVSPENPCSPVEKLGLFLKPL